MTYFSQMTLNCYNWIPAKASFSVNGGRLNV